MALRKVLSYVVVFALTAVAAVAQDPQPAQAGATTQQAVTTPEGGEPRYIKPETPEQRKTRLGTVDDPGTNPDATTLWWRFGKKFTIQKFDKRWAKYDSQEGWVRPFAPVNFAKEIYQENEKFVWVWHEERDPEPIAEDEHLYRQTSPEEVKYFESVRGEFSELTPPAADMTIRFEEASEGLPTRGSWRNSLAVADMNEDGFADLVLPPQRGAENAPSIFLGDGKGNWKLWDIVWPVGFGYGSAVVADFNKDGHQDVAFGVHLTGVMVFTGDGKGNFKEASEGIIMDFPTRRIAATDVNGDGWTDVVAISEGPVARGPEVMKTTGGNLRAYINQKGKSWTWTDIAPMGKYLGGDWLSVGNLNGDKTPDFVGSSIYFNGIDTMWLSGMNGKWNQLADITAVPFLSYYYASTTGRFDKKSKTDDAIVAYYRQWPTDLSPRVVPVPPLKMMVGIDRLTFTGNTAKRTSLARWGSGRGIWGMGRGDFDGDGNQDILYTTFEPREASVLVGDGTGKFRRAKVEGISLPGAINYDLTVADVNGDNRPDLLAMYESDEVSAFGAKNGRVQVFLNRGVVKESKP